MKIELFEYDETWPLKFKSEQELLQSLIGAYLIGSIEHVGSTSVPGMIAKPIIDIMFGVESLEKSKTAIEILSNNGYCFYPYKPDIMHWFCKPKPEFRTHHIHLVPYNSELWQERIKFRDALRNSEDLARKYIKVKKSLAESNSADREVYTGGKWPFIKSVLDAEHC